MISRKSLVLLGAIGLVVALFPFKAIAQVPNLVPIQGYITETDGTPYDAEVAIRFNLYDAPTAGTELFSERQSIPVDRGVFTAYLGAVEALDMGLFADNADVYLGIQVGADAEAAPRLMFGSVPFAALSAMTGSFGGVDAADFPTTIEEWALAACPDTIEELTAILDPVYANPAWDAITGIPEDIADGDDGFTTEEELTALLDDNYATPGWGDIVGIPADIADGDDGFTTEEELTALLDDNYRANDWAPSWADITGIPGVFGDGVDNDTTYDADAPLALDGTTFGLSGEGCEEGAVLRWDGSEWACSVDVAVTAGEGIALSDEGEISIATPIIWSGGCRSHGRTSGWNRYCLNGLDFNTADDYLAVAADGQVTMRRAGYYRVNVWAISNSCNYGYVRLTRNGSNIHYAHNYTHNVWTNTTANVIWPFDEGDVLEIWYHSSGCNSYAYHSWNASGSHSRAQISYVGPRADD